jgi:hypothetical protein
MVSSTTNTRRGRAEMAGIRAAIIGLLSADHPQTVRQVFYQLVTRGIIEKTEGEYQRTVIRLLAEMRLNAQVPWSWIVDESRRVRETQTFDSVRDALEDTAASYRRSALRNCQDYIQIWAEKEALTGIIWDVSSDYDVPVIPSKGMPSLTLIYRCFENIKRAARAGKQSYLYQFGDHDPTGVMIPQSLQSRLNEFCERNDCPPPIVERIALTEQQIIEHRLPTRPTKREGNTHALKFEGDSVELDALPSAMLRALVRESIERHISPAELHALREAEDSERAILLRLARDAEDGPLNDLIASFDNEEDPPVSEALQP